MYDQNDSGQNGQPHDSNPYAQLPPNEPASPTTNDTNNAVLGDQPQQPQAALTPADPVPTNDVTAPAEDTNDLIADSSNDSVINEGDDDLLSIKQEALQQLSPLVAHLEQTPEEKFKTTMMMIQASDDQSLIKTAYDTAKQITDEKVRAQALLDVVNEINYFTQQKNKQ